MARTLKTTATPASSPNGTPSELEAARARAITELEDAERADDTEHEPDAESEAILRETMAANSRPPRSTLHRVDPDTGARLWLAEVATETISPEWVARRFGGGKYYVAHKRARAGGGYAYAGHETYEIDASVKAEPVPDASGGGESSRELAAAAAPKTLDSIINAGVLQLFNQMNAQNQITLGMVERMLKRDDAPPRPGFAELLTALAPFAPALLELVRSRSDPTELALKIADKLKPAAPASGADVVTALEKGIAIATRLGDRAAGGAAGGDSVLPIVAEGVGALGKIVDGIMSERRTAAAFAAGGFAGAGAPAGAPVATIPAPAVQPLEDMHTAPHTGNGAAGHVAARPWLDAAGDKMPALIQFSRWMGADAAAATISRNLSDEQFSDLISDITDDSPPGFVRRLVEYFPAAAAVDPAWIQELVKHLLDSLEPEQPPAPPAPGSSSAS